ncbi:MAG: hypothetical protein NVS3B20_22800 [Polyangiales bacterium]
MADAPLEASDPDPRPEGWPEFARAYPRHPELDRLVLYFMRGNHRRVRVGAAALVASTDLPVSEAAHDLRARLDPDRLAYLLLGLTALLLASLVGWALQESKQHQHQAPPPRTIQAVPR